MIGGRGHLDGRPSDASTTLSTGASMVGERSRTTTFSSQVSDGLRPLQKSEWPSESFTDVIPAQAGIYG
ncbi:hypothetical protein [Neisseria chenwenguii]|uniref:hypothetical protein n=1 Tax=Neisseria chenwenguii TaxID=1853278 RepID=UPI000F5009B1|nr:hypothetical protein [Neisseria chenwenguii]